MDRFDYIIIGAGSAGCCACGDEATQEAFGVCAVLQETFWGGGLTGVAISATVSEEGVLMRQVSLREFRTRGVKALEEVPRGETTLLVGQNGPAYFLVPVVGNVIEEDLELRRAMAKASLRRGWEIAQEIGELSEEEIESEIRQHRAAHEPQPVR